MALNIGEASAVGTVLHWLGYTNPYPTGRPAVTDDQAADALVLLGAKASKALQLHYGEKGIRSAVAERADDLLDLEWRHARLVAGFREAQERIHFPHHGQLDHCRRTECVRARRWLMSREQLAEEARDGA